MELGQWAKDRVTGFEGVITSRTDWFMSERWVRLERLDKKGNPSSLSLPENRLEPVRGDDDR